MGTPDELHEQYFKAFPDGDKLSVFAEAQRFMNEQKELNETFVTHKWFNSKLEDLASLLDLSNLKEKIEEQLKSKVGIDQFYWIIGILMAIVIGLFGVIYAKMEKIDESQNATKTTVSNIQGLLTGAKITN